MAKRILIIGYGVAGRSLAKNLELDGQEVKGFLDDTSRNSRILGTLDTANEVIKKFKITDVYFAIPSASAQLVRNFVNRIENNSVKLSIIPRSFHVISKNTVNMKDLTDVDILALVGRQPVKHDLLECRKLVSDKTVLITGAAGSIGSRLVKMLADLKPRKIICVDWWENGTFFLQQELQSKKNVVFKIGDIKNDKFISKLFSEMQPDIVFHAAAFKHVPLMQHNPIEAFNNNVWGSFNLMQQAIASNVQHFVYVSTDKAVNPVNVMGTSKRLGEMLMETLAKSQINTKFNAVRFGNVIQSNGSLMQIFRNQIENGQPLTVTHKDVTRYFMTVEEAAQLIVQSAALGKHGEIFALDMGEPVKIIELAKSLVRVLRQPIKINITGLRPGEKMFEELTYNPKTAIKTSNDKIFIVKEEKAFDHAKFIEDINALLRRSLSYEISASEMISELKSFGFNIKN